VKGRSGQHRRNSTVFRVDGGTQLGSGHVMRCLTLARELRRRGAPVHFVCRDLPGSLVPLVETAGFVVTRLPADASSRLDAELSIATLRAERADWLVVDHYELGLDWETAVREAAGKVLVIDDLRDRSHSCDVLLDQNWHGPADQHRDDGRAPGAVRLEGPRYALLRPEYALLRSAVPRRNWPPRRVLVFFGGSDSSNETGKALEALSRPEWAQVALDVVIGRNHPCKETIDAKLRGRESAALHEGLESLAPLMIRADVGVGAGGATTWERLCLGLPSVVTTLAHNQDVVTRPLAEAGYVRWLGRSTDTTVDEYAAALATAFASADSLLPLVDGHGTARVAETLIPSGSDNLILRRARRDDAANLYHWRNDALAKAMSFDQSPITWGSHVDWLKRKLADPRTAFYILEIDSLPVGQIRFDHGARGAVLSYSLDANVRGRGFSEWMIPEAVSKIRRSSLDIVISAEVKRENEASRKVFSKLGWRVGRTETDRLVFELP
jgi:UDP-2,4-diacetamido-2,4,6-trideoxy-beta-L-altropyranose hydrolase